MPDINWPEVLVALVLAAIASELGGWIPRLSEWLVRTLAHQLPTRAARREHEWLATLEATPGQWSKLFRALTFVPAVIAIRRHTPAQAIAAPRVSRSMRFLLGFTRLQALVVFGAVAFVDGTWLLFGLFSASTPPVLGLLGFHVLAVFLYWLNWRGLGVDWPWLRTTPPGAGILLVLSTWPLFVVPFVGQATSTLLGEIWVVTLYVLWAWEGYWATTRPLPRRGLLGWRKARQ
ncbi:hypothetical protein [Deinococcus koreensis]|uniref:Uncharacterized protein n=1 Tax=Deinococcus koreensis TaxID=2054903 RepID=A0A2K3US86_9DEIO|nr:hypothetical protein [Deinococcus koreensis]PNY79388.1 hypothetical protein CVO96_19910 [Deinococcus koreensis]